jgi:AcrR family transcriptional regulator
LLLAARRVFERKGYGNSRIEDITEEAGYAIGSFYTYFNSKEEVFDWVLDDIAERLLPTPRRKISEVAPVRKPQEAAERLCRANLRYWQSFGAEERRLWALFEEATLINADAKDHYVKRRHAHRRENVPRLKEWQKAGIIAADLDIPETLSALAAMTSWVFALQHVYDHPYPCPLGPTEITAVWVGAFGIGRPVRTTHYRIPPISTFRTASEKPGAEPLGAKAIATRQMILDSARQTFSEMGLADTGIRDLAAGAGVSVGTIYKYFDSKRDVLEQILTSLSREMRPHEVDEPVRAKIRRANRAYLAEVRANPGLWRTMAEAALTNPSTREEIARRRNEHVVSSALAIERWQQAHLVKAHVDPLPTAAALTALGERQGHLWYVLGQSPPSPNAAAESITDIWCRVLGVAS